MARPPRTQVLIPEGPNPEEITGQPKSCPEEKASSKRTEKFSRLFTNQEMVVKYPRDPEEMALQGRI